MKRFTKNMLAVMAGLAIVACATASPAGTIIIDNFDDPNPATDWTLMQNNHTVIQTSAAAILGGQRDLAIDVASGGAGSASGPVGEGLLISSAGGTIDADTRVQYDGVDVEPGTVPLNNADNIGPGAFDLTGGGLNPEFFIDFISTDGGSVATSLGFSIEVHSAGGNATFAGLQPDGANVIRTVPFNDPLFAGVDFTQVTSITYRFNALNMQVATDLIINTLGVNFTDPTPPSSVPEPSAAILAAMSLVGLGLLGARRRRRIG